MRGEEIHSNHAVSDAGAGSGTSVSLEWMCGSPRQLAGLLPVPVPPGLKKLLSLVGGDPIYL